MAHQEIGVLFDLDGVILDSEGTYTEFWDSIELKFPTHIPNFSHVIKGSNLHSILHTYYKTDEMRNEITILLDEFQQTMRYKYFDGAIEFVEQLNNADIPCCIVTSSDSRKMEALFEQKPDFKNHFNKIVTGDMVTKAKPDPECFLLGAKLIGVVPEKCYVFEDSINGLKAGLAAGATVIGLSTTNPAIVIESISHKVISNFKGFSVADMLSIKKQ